MQRLPAALLVVATAVSLTTCRGVEAIGPAVPASAASVSGNHQTGIAGHTLPQPLTVLVTTANGAGVPGVLVHWAIASGGGSLSASTAATDSLGHSSVTLTLGPNASPHDTVTATVDGLPPVVFSLGATADVPVQLVTIAGDGQHGPAGQALTAPLVVETRDQFGNPTAGTSIAWSVTAGGGSLSAAVVITDAAGQAAVTWTVGPAAGAGIDSVTANAAGLAGSPAHFGASADPGPVASLALVSGDSQTASVAQTVADSLVVVARDQFGNGVGGIAVQWSAAAGNGSVSQGSVPTDAAGRSAVRWTLGTSAGAEHASATVSGVPGSPIDFDALALPGAPAKLAFIAQPQNATAGATFTPTVQVAILDVFGNPVTAATDAVTLTLATNPSGATLGGTTLDTATGGVASFATLHIEKAAAGYTLQASAPGLTADASATFTILPGSATQCVFSGQPSDVAAGTAISPALRVDALDAFDNLATSYVGNVTLTLASNPGGGTLSGTPTITAASGTAVFANLSLNKAASGYTLSAACSGLAGATSAPFDVGAAPASRLLFTTEPTTTGASSPIAPPVQVTALDALDNTATSFTGSVTVAIGANPTGGALSGTTTVSAVSGVATFPDLHVDKSGTGYTLTAAAAAVTAATSAAFDITTAPTTLLAFTTQPSNATAGVTIAPAIHVTAKDGQGNTVTSFTGNVTVAIATNPSGGALSGTLTVAAVAGVATFNDLSIDKSGAGYILLASAASLASASSAAFTITAGAVSASQSTVTSAPGTITASNGASASTITVTAKDALGNPVPGATVVLAASGTSHSLTQPASPTGANGVATGSLSATLVGSKTVSATISGVAINQTATVVVTPATAAVLVFTGQPTNTAATGTINGSTGGVVVTARDAFGNTATGFTAGVTMAIGTNPGTGTLSGTLTPSALAGVATFTDLSINTPGTGYKLRATSGALPAVLSASFNITGASVVVAAGAGQTGLKGFALNVPPAVLVRDATNTPIANAPVAFAVASGGGSVTGAVATTDVNGIATIGSWTVQLGSNTLTATVAGQGITGNPVTFTATGVNSAYHIDVRFLTPMSASRQAVFTNAASRWETLIYGDVPNISVDVPARSCGDNSPRLKETVDDIVIYATVDSIDGPSNILGAAGPCGFRSSGKLPFAGAMIFDSADVAQLESDGQFELVILHEMGHVLGYGTIWTDLNLLKSAGKADPHFSGTQATSAFDRFGGLNYSAGAKVPVENCVGFPAGVCGSGTQDSHWRELVFANELMTGFIDVGPNPLSVVTTASMGDLGYTVNYAASDSYTVTNPVAAVQGRPRPPRELKDDILRLPIVEVDATGRVVAVHPPR